jgi:cleavage and polyadenylation specificity factor subunit 1
LAQIVPVSYQESGEEGPNVNRARICDPYVLLIRIDGSVLIYKVDLANLELAEEERGPKLKSTKYLSGCVYPARRGSLIYYEDDNGTEETDYIMFLLTVDGGLQVYDLEDLSAPIFVAESFSTLHPLLRGDDTTTGTGREKTFAKESLVEILVADLGDPVSKEPYLIVHLSSLSFPLLNRGANESENVGSQCSRHFDVL